MKATINGVSVECNFEKGDRVCVCGQPEDTGTVRAIGWGVYVHVDWDEHCMSRLGKNWLPTSIEKILN